MNMNQENQTVKPDELKKFNEVLQHNGYQEGDFNLREIKAKSEEKDSKLSQLSQDQTQNCKIAVKNSKTGKEKTYQAGAGQNWIQEFERDLKNQQFK